MAAGIDESDSNALAIDIGTNGEIILGSKDKIRAASTAAGPAFEGWHVSCGMRATDGAIESIRETAGELQLKVIGGGEPRGISGSALIDIVAILLNRGRIDASGKMGKDFVIHGGKKKIVLTQADVRQVQLAKGAFSSGASFLKKLSGREIDKVFITGSFGRYLNKESAARVGIVPKDTAAKGIEFIDNGALKGAEGFIMDKESALKRIENILAKTEHVSLARDEDFQRHFASAMGF